MPNLFDPISIGPVRLKNRIIGAPTVMQRVDSDGHITPECVTLYGERARGGAGLITVEATALSHDSMILSEPMPVILNERDAKDMGRLADAIHRGGARATIQLCHAGRFAISPAAPSEVPFYGIIPRVLTTGECDELITTFGRAAGWLKDAGYDAVSLHGAHGWLIQQFMSPYTNRRTDKFGRRMLFPTEVVRSIKARAGKDFPVIFRMTADEFIGDKGITLDMACKEIVPALEEAGVNCLDISCGTLEPYRMHWFVQPLYQPRGVILHLAGAVKKVAEVPVVAVGRINDPRLAEKVVREGTADLVNLSRALLADPEFPRKAQEGRSEEIRKCLACDACEPSPEPGRCAAHAFLGKEVDLSPAPREKRVLVIGAGPGGLEAARVAGMKGHQVTLWEREKKPGGGINMAAFIPRVYTRELNNIVQWQCSQIKKMSNVTMKLNTTATPEDIAEFVPDAVIVATGSRPDLPQKAVASGDIPACITVDDYLMNGAEIGERVIVVGRQYGLEVAVSLAKQGKHVTIVEDSPVNWVGDVPLFRKVHYMARARLFMIGELLKSSGVKILDKTVLRTMGGGAVSLRADDQEMTVPADTVIFAAKRHPERGLADGLAGKVPELYAVGDCASPRRILEAVHEGAAAALAL